MTAKRLLSMWVLGFVVASFALLGRDLVPYKSRYQREFEALQRDSAAAAARADSVRTANGDSIAAYVYVPPDPLGLHERGRVRDEMWNGNAAGFLGLALVWRTIGWYRSRKNAPATTT
ncbi:MAG TPA: hypothetical protein VJR92_09350 [Gemmatimonadaceae bacterium]|nr:hypothetical protein [Gemmatimonadaceae bacterium]